jgi:Poly(ADP-ribose) polymerase catalytic domain
MWACANCTLENEEGDSACAACEVPRPVEKGEEEDAEEDAYDEGEEEGEEEEEEEGYDDEEEEEEDYDPGDGELGASLGVYSDPEDDLLDDGDAFDSVVGDALQKAGFEKVQFVCTDAMEVHNVEGEPPKVVLFQSLKDGNTDANTTAENNATTSGNSSTEAAELDGGILVRAAIDLSNVVDPLMARIWGVAADLPVVLEMVFQGPMYVEEAKLPPLFALFQTSDTDLTKRKLGSRRSFGLEWQLRSRLDDWLNKADVWPASRTQDRGRGFLNRAMAEVVQRVLDCTHTCMICDRELPFAMVKPSICDNVLCIHSHEQYGLGADVATEIRESPEVVDLLISLCYAASQNDIRRFNPFPVGVQASIPRQNGMPGTATIDFMKESWQQKMGSAAAAAAPPRKKAKKGKTEANQRPDFSDFADASKVKEVLDQMPPVAELVDAHDSQALKAVLDARHPLLFPLLRWVITSNRAHLQRLAPEEQIPEMQTNMQFKFVSSPPEKEAEFQRLKKTSGSFWAFHGSQFSNWHSILRVGLKNYSGTAMMSTGAAYGAGIYLSPNSGTSSGYSRPLPGWPKSGLSSGGNQGMQCLCICEVIDAKYKAKPHCMSLAPLLFLLFLLHPC